MVPLVTPQNLPDFVIGGVLLALGALVLAARPREPTNAYFAAFMAFLGAGVILAAVHGWTLQAYRAAIQAGSPGALAWWDLSVRAEKLFWIMDVFDPLALLYFASIYPRRNRLNRPAVLVPAALVAAAFLAVVLATSVPPPATYEDAAPVTRIFSSPLARAALLTYLLAIYVTALTALALDLPRVQGEVTRKRLELLVIAFGVAVFPRVGLALSEIRGLPLFTVEVFATRTSFIATRLILLAASFAALWAFYALLRLRLPAGEHATLRTLRNRTALLVLALALVVWLPAPLVIFLGLVDLQARPDWLWQLVFVLERAIYSSRWLVFGGLIAYSLLRYQLFDLGARARLVAVEAALAVTLVGGVAVAAALLVPTDPAAFPGGVPGLLLTAIVVSVACVRAIDALSRRVTRSAGSRGTDEAIRLRKLDVFRAAVEASLESGGADAARLERLRDELGLDPAEAAAVERLARAPRAGGALLPGVVVGGRYEIESLLGRGGSARAFLVRDPLLRRKVVIKEIADARGAAQALAEARVVGSLSHPNIVAVHDTLPWGGGYLIVMEWVERGTLQTLLDEADELPADAARVLAEDVLSGLAAVHERGLVHGDVKPANVLLTRDGHAKVADFGIARAARAATETFHRAAQALPHGMTRSYSAPEVAAGAEPTPASDVYSAGLVLRALLERAPGLDAPGMQALVQDALRADPRERPSSAVELKRRFDALAPRGA